MWPKTRNWKRNEREYLVNIWPGLVQIKEIPTLSMAELHSFLGPLLAANVNSSPNGSGRDRSLKGRNTPDSFWYSIIERTLPLYGPGHPGGSPLNFMVHWIRVWASGSHQSSGPLLWRTYSGCEVHAEALTDKFIQVLIHPQRFLKLEGVSSIKADAGTWKKKDDKQLKVKQAGCVFVYSTHVLAAHVFKSQDRAKIRANKTNTYWNE